MRFSSSCWILSPPFSPLNLFCGPYIYLLQMSVKVLSVGHVSRAHETQIWHKQPPLHATFSMFWHWSQVFYLFRCGVLVVKHCGQDLHALHFVQTCVIESAAATELRSKCMKVDVNTFAAVQYNNRTLRVPYHYCYDLPHMCIWWEWLCFSSFLCKNCICIISQVSASYTSHNLLCSFPGIPTCQWCYVDTICLYKIDKLNLYCLVFSVVVLFRRLSHLWMKKTATNQINNN